MITYVALLRGIMPSNPNMSNEKLRNVFCELGFSNVRTVISSGNVIFESKLKNTLNLEINIERALLKNLGIKSPAYIREKKELENIIKKNPFKNAEHSRKTYLIVSFLRQSPKEIFTTIDVTSNKPADFMRILDKKFAKNVTTRTWKTIERVVKKMNI